MAYNPYYGQYAQGTQYRSQYQYQDKNCDRGRGRTPRASRDFRRDDPLRGAGHLGTPADDGLYERIRCRLDVGKNDLFDDNFDRIFKEAWIKVDRAAKDAGINHHHLFPRTMPPQGAGQFDGYAPVYTPGYSSGYGYAPARPRYCPDPPRYSPARPRSRSRSPPTGPYPHPPRDRDRDRRRSRSRPTDRTNGRRRQRTRSKHTEPEPEPEPVWYTYVGTTDPDGEILDGYDG